MKTHKVAFPLIIGLVLMYTSAFSQSNWKLTSSKKQLISIGKDKNAYAISDGDLQISSNNGATWHSPNNESTPFNLNISTYSKIEFLDSLTGFYIADSSFYKTVDGGKTWNKKHIDGIHSNIITDFEFIDQNIGILCIISSGYFYTTDGGENFDFVDLSTDFKASYLTNLSVKNNSFYLGGRANTILKSTDAVNWVALRNMANSPINPGNTLDISFKDDSNGVALMDANTILYTSNGGLTWKSNTVNGLNNKYITKIEIAKDNEAYFTTDTNLFIYNYKLNTYKKIVETKSSISNLIFDETIGFFYDSLQVYNYQRSNIYYWESGFWLNGKPTVNDTVILNDNYTTSINGYINCNYLQINAGKKLIIDTQNEITSGSINNEGTVFCKFMPNFQTLYGNKFNRIASFPAIGKQKKSSISLALSQYGPDPENAIYTIENNVFASLSENVVTFSDTGMTFISSYLPENLLFNASKITKQKLVVLSDSIFDKTPIEIANWFNNYQSATVLTYDDWSPGQTKIAFPEHIKRNLPATFAVTIANIGATYLPAYNDQYIYMKEGVEKGMEISNHTNHHTDLTKSDLTKEVEDARLLFDKNITNQKIETFAYPFGSYNQTVINYVKQNHIAARTIDLPTNGWVYDFASNLNDYYKIPTQEVNDVLGINGFKDTLLVGIKNGALLTYMFHSINGASATDTWWDVVPEEMYKAMLDTLSNYKDQTWICTFANAIKYHKMRKFSSFEILSGNPRLSNTNNDFIFNLKTDSINLNTHITPLTFNYYYTNNEKINGVIQNNISIPYNLANGLLTFNAYPINGPVTINRDLINVIEDQNLYYSIYPNPSNRLFEIKSATEILDLKLTNNLGAVIPIKNKSISLHNASFEIENNGLYILEVLSKSGTYFSKVVKY